MLIIMTSQMMLTSILMVFTLSGLSCLTIMDCVDSNSREVRDYFAMMSKLLIARQCNDLVDCRLQMHFKPILQWRTVHQRPLLVGGILVHAARAATACVTRFLAALAQPE